MSVEGLFVRSVTKRSLARTLRQIAYYMIVLSILILMLATATLPGLNQAMYLMGTAYDGKAIVDEAQAGTITVSEDNVIVKGRVEAGVLLAERNAPGSLYSPSADFEYAETDFSDDVVVQGKPPRNLRAGEIALSTALAKTLDVSLGDDVYVLNMSAEGNEDYCVCEVASILACHYAAGDEAVLGGAGVAFLKPNKETAALFTNSRNVVYYSGSQPATAVSVSPKSEELDESLGFLRSGVSYGTVIALACLLLFAIAGKEISYVLSEQGKSIAVLYSCGARMRKVISALVVKELFILIASGIVALLVVKRVVESPLVLLNMPLLPALLYLAVVFCVGVVAVLFSTKRALGLVEKMDVSKLLAKGAADE